MRNFFTPPVHRSQSIQNPNNSPELSPAVQQFFSDLLTYNSNRSSQPSAPPQTPRVTIPLSTPRRTMNPEATLNEGLQQAINAAVTNAIAPLRQENESLCQQLEALRTSTSASTNNNPVPSMPKAPKSVPVTPFEGDQDKWDAFVTQIKLKIAEYPFYFTTDRLKVIYMLQWMQGRTMAWASSYLDQVNSSTPAPELDSWDRMLATATAAWGIHDREGRAEQKLLALTQASTKSGTVSEYRSEFQQVAQVTKWNDEALSRQFYNGLKRPIKYGLLSMPKSKNLQELIQNSLDFETRWLELRSNTTGPRAANVYQSNPSSSRPIRDPNAMDVDASRLSQEDQDRHFKQGLCFICHKAGHIARECPDKKKSPRTFKARASVVEDKEVKEDEIEKEVQRRLAAALKDFQKGQE